MEVTSRDEYFRILKTALDEAALPVHFVGPDGIILWANKAELDLLGYSPEEYIGKPISDFHEDGPVIEDILHRLSAHETLREYPARLRRRDGSIRHVRITSNVHWEGDRFVHTRCFTRDVTEQLHAEATVFQLSAPILEIETGLLLLPLVGTVNQYRAELITSELLDAVKQQRARAVVLDLTGAADVDAYVLKVLINLCKTCRGLGATVVLSGISAALARRVVELQVATDDLTAVASLRDGIREAKAWLRR